MAASSISQVIGCEDRLQITKIVSGGVATQTLY